MEEESSTESSNSGFSGSDPPTDQGAVPMEAEETTSTERDLVIQRECLDLFASTDYIMEPTIFDTIKTYFMHGGEPGPVVDLLSDNYVIQSIISSHID